MGTLSSRVSWGGDLQRHTDHQASQKLLDPGPEVIPNLSPILGYLGHWGPRAWFMGGFHWAQACWVAAGWIWASQEWGVMPLGPGSATDGEHSC